MSNRKQRDKNRKTDRELKEQLNPFPHICSNCGIGGSHFVPPGFGSGGFFACERISFQPIG